MSLPDFPPLKLSPLILGGAGFSYQLVPTPTSAPLSAILAAAFTANIRTIDTSPYYEPSEQLLGAVLSAPDFAANFPRDSYVLMTKAGRIKADVFDYSPEWITKSVRRSLERFQTEFLDVVFVHDVEFQGVAAAVDAVGALLELGREGVVRYVGISGYKLDVLAGVAAAVRERFGRPLDVVQTWAQLTLQNTVLESQGLTLLREAGVRNICASSPMAVGLLREKGVPIGTLGDWHPAPEGLRVCARNAAERVKAEGEGLASLALRYAIRKAVALSGQGMTISTISGVATLEELEENVATARKVLGHELAVPGGNGIGSVETNAMMQLEQRDDKLSRDVRDILKDWLDFPFS